MADRVGEWTDHLGEFRERPWPAVNQNQRERVWLLRPSMNEVYGDPIDGRLELLELVEAPFLRPPVEFTPPVRDEILEIRGVGAVGPARPIELFG